MTIEDRHSIIPAQAGIQIKGHAITPARPSAHSFCKDHHS